MKYKFFIPVAALLLYSGLFWFRAVQTQIFSRDGYTYCQAVQVWRQSGPDAMYRELKAISPEWGSMPPLLLAGAAELSWPGSSAKTAILVYNYLCGILFVLGGWLAGCALTEEEWGPAVTVFSCAVLPSFLRISSDLLRDGSYISYVMFAVGALLYAIKAERGGQWWAALGGAAAAAALFSRREGVELIVAVGCWGLWELFLAIRRRDSHRSRILVRCAYFFAVFAVLTGIGWYAVRLVPSCEWQLLPFHKAEYVWKHLAGRLW